MSSLKNRLHGSSMALVYGGSHISHSFAAEEHGQEDLGGGTSSLAGLFGGNSPAASSHEHADEGSPKGAATFTTLGSHEPTWQQAWSSAKRQRTKQPAHSMGQDAYTGYQGEDSDRWMQEGLQGAVGAQQQYHDVDHSPHTSRPDAPNIDNAVVDDDDSGSGDQQPADDAQPPPLTTITMNGILMMDDRLNSIEYKIHEMAAMGVQRLDQIKAAFVDEMDKFIKELQSLRNSQHSKWSALAADTLEENSRLAMAKALMSSLGLDATAKVEEQSE